MEPTIQTENITAPVMSVPTTPIAPLEITVTKKSSVLPKLLLGILLVAIIILSGVLGYYAGQAKSNSAATPTPTPTPIVTLTPSVTESVTPVVTTTETKKKVELDFYKTLMGDTQITTMPVVFEIPMTGYEAKRVAVSASCYQYEVNSTNSSAFKLLLTLNCNDGGPNEETVLPTGWQYIGVLPAAAEDGSSINVVRIPAVTATYAYVNVLKDPPESAVQNGNKYVTNSYTLAKKNPSGDAGGPSYLNIRSALLTITTTNATERAALLKIADEIILNIYIK